LVNDNRSSVSSSRIGDGGNGVCGVVIADLNDFTFSNSYNRILLFFWRIPSLISRKRIIFHIRST